MDRRAFLGVIAGGLLAAPLAAEGQQAGKVYRLGILSPTSQERSGGNQDGPTRPGLRRRPESRR